MISGVGKSFAVADFSALIIQYGLEKFTFLAPVIIIAEILIGLLLIFRVWQRRVSLGALLLLIVFTLTYLYGYLFNNVEDCGCFGVFPINFSPTLIFIRNIVLIYLLFEVWRNSKSLSQTAKIWEIITMSAIVCVASFISGYTVSDANNKIDYGKKKQYQGKAVQDIVLKEFVTTSQDSTYLVFAFTYSCPFCLNSIENLKQYERIGVVDKVIGLALKDSVSESNFRKNFNPEFQIESYTPRNLFRLTNSFPRAYYIRNDSVVLEIVGTLPCGYVLLEKIEDEKS